MPKKSSLQIMITLVAAVLVSLVHAEVKTITVVAQALEGTPLEDVVIRVSQGDASVETTTDLAGFAKATFAVEEGTQPTVSPASDEWRVASRVQSGGFVILQLFPSDMTKLSSEELGELAQLQGAMLESRRENGERATGNAATPHTLRLSAFLNGWRDPDPRLLENRSHSTPKSEVNVSVVDGFGSPIAGRSVHLLTMNEETGRVELYERERSDEGGNVRFRSVPAGRIYRAEAVVEDDSRSALSNFFVPEIAETLDLDALVLRQPGESISGIVVNENLPVYGVRIVAKAKGGTELQTFTDQFGYFQLSPVASRPIEIKLQRPGQNAVDWTIDEGEGEPVIPIVLLEKAAGKVEQESNRQRTEQIEENEKNRRLEAEALESLKAQFGQPEANSTAAP